MNDICSGLMKPVANAEGDPIFLTADVKVA